MFSVFLAFLNFTYLLTDGIPQKRLTWNRVKTNTTNFKMQVCRKGGLGMRMNINQVYFCIGRNRDRLRKEIFVEHYATELPFVFSTE